MMRVSSITTTVLVAFVAVEMFGQSEPRLNVGVYSGLNLSWFDAAYRSSPLPGWKAGLLADTDLQPRLGVSARLGVTQDRCRINAPMLSYHTFWKYLWADFTPMLHYIPLRQDKFSLSVGSGISVKRIIKSSIGDFDSSDGDLYKWTYFIPFQISTTFNLASQRRLGLAVEYSQQLRPMYESNSSTYPDSGDMAYKLHNWNLVASYTLPIRRG